MLFLLKLITHEMHAIIVIHNYNININYEVGMSYVYNKDIRNTYS